MSLHEPSVLLLGSKCLLESKLIQIILDRVVLEGLVRGRLQVVRKWLQRRLYVVPVIDFNLFLAVEFVVAAEEVNLVSVAVYKVNLVIGSMDEVDLILVDMAKADPVHVAMDKVELIVMASYL